MFWPEYLADTGHLDTEQHGAYMLLIAHYWMNESIPFNDDYQLMQITRLTRHKIKKFRPFLEKFFPNGRQKRIDYELARAAEKSRKMSENAQQRYSKSTCNGTAEADTPTPTKKEKNTNYFFEDGVIRLNQADFEKWRDAFPNIDLKAELLALSAWAGEQANWFHAVKGALAKRNRENKPRQQAPKTTEDILNPTDRRAAWGLP